MSRPENNRIVNQPPLYAEFKPTNVRAKTLETIQLSIDEFEALRLADYDGLSHEEAADKMNISRPTFSRLISKSRKKMADFLVLGRLLLIEGGNIHFKNNVLQCTDCGYSFTSGFTETDENCPQCQSKNLINLAKGFGHGNCCINNNNNINKKGGHHARRK